VANTKVQSEQIEDGSITADKLADGTIVAAELADNAVTTAKINADAVTGAKIADDAIDSEHYTDGSIDTAHIADAQITVAKMAANSVDSDQYVDGSIDTVHLGDLQVTTAKIANGNISTAKIADNAVTSAKIDTNIDIAGTFDVTGATTLDSTLSVAGTSTLATTAVVGSGSTPFATQRNVNTGGFAMIQGKMGDSASTTAGHVYSALVAGIEDNTNGAEDGYFAVEVSEGGSGDEKLRIKSNGNVGIGTTSPRGVLDLGSGSGDGTLDNTPANYQLILEAAQSTTGDIGRNIAFVNSTNDVSAAINSVDGGAGLTQDLMFAVAASGTLSEIMRLDAAGKVGIGTTSPSTKLEVTDANGVGLRFGDVASTPSSQTAGYIGMSTSAYSGNNGDLVLIPRTSAASNILLMEGNVGIGTTSPDGTLHIKGSSDTYIYQEAGSSTGNAGILFQNNSGQTRGYVIYDTDDDLLLFQVNQAERMRITSEGRLCLGFTAKQEDAFLSIISNGSEGLFNGTAGTNRYRRYFHTASDGIHRFEGSANTATLTNAGAWSDASDVAYKEDIQDISYGLDAVTALRPRKYKMKGTDLGNGEGLEQKIGFIAQEAELVVPEVVDGKDGEKTLSYGQLTAVLVKAIQEQQTIIEDLKARIETLEG